MGFFWRHFVVYLLSYPHFIGIYDSNNGISVKYIYRIYFDISVFLVGHTSFLQKILRD